MSLLTLLIVAIVILVLFGGWGHYHRNPGEPYPYIGWAPLSLVLVLLIVLLVTGGLR